MYISFLEWDEAHQLYCVFTNLYSWLPFQASKSLSNFFFTNASCLILEIHLLIHFPNEASGADCCACASSNIAIITTLPSIPIFHQNSFLQMVRAWNASSFNEASVSSNDHSDPILLSPLPFPSLPLWPNNWLPISSSLFSAYLPSIPCPIPTPNP